MEEWENGRMGEREKGCIKDIKYIREKILAGKPTVYCLILYI